MEIEVKIKYNLPDPQKYFNLFQSTGWNEEYRLSCDELYSSLQNTYFCVCIYSGEELVGFGRIVSDGILHAMIYEMIVRPDVQGKQLGRTILDKLKEKCREDNIRDVQLFCAKGKRGFYEKNGFTARPDDAPGMDLKV